MVEGLVGWFVVVIVSGFPAVLQAVDSVNETIADVPMTMLASFINSLRDNPLCSSF